MLVVVDCGSQYTASIGRRLAAIGVRVEVLSVVDPIPPDARGIIVSGGPSSVHDSDAPNLSPALWKAELPVLALCYGMQAMAQALGGRVERGNVGYGGAEYGMTKLRGYGQLGDWTVPKDSVVWMSHSDSVVELPPGFECLAHSASLAAMACPARGLYALQFHPEVEHTQHGDAWLAAFARLCGESVADELPLDLENLRKQVRAQVGERRGIVAVSGGVDSTTLAVLLLQIGVNVQPVFIDNGLLRENEAQEVEESLRAQGLPLKVIDAQERFLQALSGVSDPDEKRRRIGKEFADILSLEAKNIGATWLAQGTLVSDVIESGHKGGAQIKRHHNVGGLPKSFGLELVEPFRELYKDQVRQIANELGLPKQLTWRHPFPGPGLAIRVAGALSAERLQTVRAADAIFVQELRERNLYELCAQAFAVLLEGRAVGVTGDARAYKEVICLRAVNTKDYMTADWVGFDKSDLDAIASRILAQVPTIGRVLYDLTQKPPGTIEWE